MPIGVEGYGIPEKGEVKHIYLSLSQMTGERHAGEIHIQP